ncbi:Zinc finger BED domain-containing protein 4 [Frankliniella fusca]|uniref:Zinc finger BED domain-containing protein 4 n=1 Tax=Frankliniella fusca TaxID=407009 RepID=A0AAE1L9N7_9NEOP|nr:Zinc finger BED domain-containing protein 4 [Frankliniella fusca]
MAPSVVWTYFKKVDNGKKVKCLKCSKELCFNKSTSALLTHLETVHRLKLNKQNKRKREDTAADSDPDDPSSTSQDNDTPSASTGNASGDHSAPASPALNSPPAKSRSHTSASAVSPGPMDRCLSTSASFSAGGHRDVTVTNALVFMIAKDDMPLSTTSREGFRFFCNKLQPLYKLPSVPTITKKGEMTYEELRPKFAAEIAAVQSITLTADIWTSQAMKSHLGVTCHYPKGKDMISVELCAKPLDTRSTIPHLRTALRDVCTTWGIKDEAIIAFVTDGGANIKGAVREEFGVLKHVTCFAHQLNGIGQAAIGLHTTTVPSEAGAVPRDIPDNEDDLDDDDVQGDGSGSLKDLIIRTKKIVRFIRTSTIATAELLALQKEKGTPEHLCLKLKQEVRTRWNSAYEMLERFLQLADEISRVLLKCQRDRGTKARPPNMLNGEELEALTEVKELMKPLNEVTREISSEKTTTLSKCIPLVHAMQDKIRQFMAVTPVGFNLQQALLNLIGKSFSGIENLRPYAAATLLDPRFKRAAFSSPAAVASIVSHIGKLVAEEIASDSRSIQEELTAAAVETPAESIWSEFDQRVRDSAVDASQDAAGGLPIEFRQYLNRPACSRKENIFVLWGQLKAEYPHVYKVAMRFVPALGTSVPSERLFSHAGLISTKLRNRLSGNHFGPAGILKELRQQVFHGYVILFLIYNSPQPVSSWLS